MSGFLTEKKLNSTIDIPLSLPQTELYPTNSVVLATICLQEGQSLTHQVMQVHVLAINGDGQAAPLNDNRSIPARGHIFVSIEEVSGSTYASLADGFTENYTPTLALGPIARNVNTPCVASIPKGGASKIYVVKVTNNCTGTNSKLCVCATGSIRLNLNAS